MCVCARPNSDLTSAIAICSSNRQPTIADLSHVMAGLSVAARRTMVKTSRMHRAL